MVMFVALLEDVPAWISEMFPSDFVWKATWNVHLSSSLATLHFGWGQMLLSGDASLSEPRGPGIKASIVSSHHWPVLDSALWTLLYRYFRISELNAAAVHSILGSGLATCQRHIAQTSPVLCVCFSSSFTLCNILFQDCFPGPRDSNGPMMMVQTQTNGFFHLPGPIDSFDDISAVG